MLARSSVLIDIYPLLARAYRLPVYLPIACQSVQAASIQAIMTVAILICTFLRSLILSKQWPLLVICFAGERACLAFFLHRCLRRSFPVYSSTLIMKQPHLVLEKVDADPGVKLRRYELAARTLPAECRTGARG